MRSGILKVKVILLHSIFLGLLLVLLTGCDKSSGGAGEKPTLDGSSSTSVSGMRLVTLTGNSRQIGYQHGYLLANDIKSMFENYVLVIANDYAAAGFDYNRIRSMVDTITVWSAEETEEMNGVIEGMKDAMEGSATVTLSNGTKREIDLLDMKAANTLTDWGIAVGCSGFTAWGDMRGGEGTLMARNLDYWPGPGNLLMKKLTVFAVKNTESGRSWVSVGWPGIIGCLTCISKEGFEIAIYDVDGFYEGTASKFVARPIAARHVIERATDVSSAKNILAEYPSYRNGNFHIALPDSGKTSDKVSASVEAGWSGSATGSNVTVRYPSDETDKNYIAVTNHWLKRVNTSGGYHQSYYDSSNRYSVIASLLDSESADDRNVSIDDATQILRYVQMESSDSLTIYSAYFTPNDNKLYLSVATGVDNPAPEAPKAEFDLSELLK